VATPSRWLFDLWSLVYDFSPVQALVYRPVHDAVVARLRELQPRRVLDVGCGTGLLTARLRRELPAATVVGCDFSPGMLARAAGRDPRGWWVRGDAQQLPVASACFDALVCTESFHWYADQRAALHEFFRVVVPGGLVLIETVNPSVELAGRLAGSVGRLVGTPFVWPTREQMRTALEAVGFRVEGQRAIVRLPAPLLFPGVLALARRPACS